MTKLLTLLPLIIKLWPVIKPILPVIIKLVKENEGLLRQFEGRPDTNEIEDTRDFFREVDKKDAWNPFKKYWEE